MTDDDAKKRALADYCQALEVLADTDDSYTAKALFLLLWEQFGPEIAKGAADEGYECPVEWAEDHIISAHAAGVMESCGPGVYVLSDDEASAFEDEREEASLH